MGAVIEIDFRRHRDELTDSWQGRLVRHTCMVDFDLVRPKGRLGQVVLSMLAHRFDDALVVLLKAVFPLSYEGRPGSPMLCTIGRVNKAGRVVADLITKDDRLIKRAVLFRSTVELRSRFRDLADELFFSDDERLAMFDCLTNPQTGWLACDERLDPRFDRLDPDAKRLTVD